jgi:hypothetical protein
MSAKEEATGMDILKEIANISGKSGLFKVLKPSRAGVIVESLNEKREKLMIGPTARISVLKDVSVFTDGGDQDSVPLGDVFLRIDEKHQGSINLDVKTSSDKDLIEFLAAVLPDFDRSKVYVSDIKKIISWYSILKTYTPDAFTTVVEEEVNEEVVVEEIAEEAKLAKAEKKTKKK